jgi:hypothetical protein
MIDKFCGSTTTFSCDDPTFAAIAEHKALSKETGRLEAAMRIARKQAEKKHGKSLEGAALLIAAAEDTRQEYDQFNLAAKAKRKAAQRMARTKPLSSAGAYAMITHARRELCRDSESAEDWVTIALKTVAAVLTGAA